MNKAQMMNLAVSLIVGGTGAAVAKLGISPDNWTKDVEDLVLLLVAGGTWLAAHLAHGKGTDGAQGAKVSGGSNGLLAAVLAGGLLAAAAAGITGCTTTAQTTAYNTIGAVEATAQTAFDGYCVLVIKGTVATNSVPQVAAAYNQLQADALLAATVASEGTNGLATASLTADLAALTGVVSTAATIK